MIAAGALPGEPGVYARTFRLGGPVILPTETLDSPVFAAGDYVYAGSAFGPGGIRARVSRHLRADTKPDCCIHHLSACAAWIDLKICPSGRECALVADKLAAGADVPVPRFGGSDFSGCAAHLVRLAARYQNGNIANREK